MNKDQIAIKHQKVVETTAAGIDEKRKVMSFVF